MIGPQLSLRLSPCIVQLECRGQCDDRAERHIMVFLADFRDLVFLADTQLIKLIQFSQWKLLVNYKVSQNKTKTLFINSPPDMTQKP